MKQNNVVDIAHYRKKETRVRKRVNRRKKGSVYTRNGKLWVDFYYLGKRVREPSGFNVSPENRVIVRKQLDLINAEIDNGVFKNRFPVLKKYLNPYGNMQGQIHLPALSNSSNHNT